MSSYSFQSLPEVFPATSAEKGLIEAGLRAGQLRRIRRGLYTTNLQEELDIVVKRNLWRVVSILCPGSVVSHRTAFDSKPSTSGVVTVTGDYDRRLELPGLRIRQIKGPGPLPGDAQFVGGLTISSRPRFLLECMSGKVYGEDSPFLTTETIEEFLDRLLVLGEPAIIDLRDNARSLAGPLGREREFEQLDSIIGALRGTRQATLTTALARSKGVPYDAPRIELFQRLVDELHAWPETIRSVPADGFENAGFFDAYFSNFIEGTEFEVEDAREIIFGNKIPSARPADAHDILGTFRIVGNTTLMKTRVSDLPADAFLSLIQTWHSTILEGRPDKRPGRFKEVANRAGHTVFVEPALVPGTLRHGFEVGRTLRTPFARAVFFLFMISEVHPFDDGNGRLARAVANSELLAHGQSRLIVPTVFRVEYLDSLRQLTRESQARTFVRMADQVQEFTADIDFSEFDLARARLTAWRAFESDSEARLRRPTS